MSKFTNSVLRAFVRELHLTKPRSYTNRKNVIQSSVGMIFKLYTDFPLKTSQDILKAEFDKIELLFTQRAGYEKDKNACSSYIYEDNVVFPGGQCDQQETDLQACRRQLYQEINLNVDQQCIYIGQLPENFYYLKKRGSAVYISCHVWCLKQNQLQWREKLNQDELRASKWVNYQQLLEQQRYVVSNALRLGLIERMALKFKFLQNISKNVTNVTLPELDLGMDRNLWGLTLWLWSFTINMALRNLIQNKKEEKVSKQNLQILKYEINHTQQLQVNFREYYPLKYPVLAVIKIWHKMNRVRPFSYERRNQTRAKVTLVLFVLITCFVYYFVN